MVVKLRQVLNDKTKKGHTLISLVVESNEKKKKEYEDIISKAIKMVIINTAVGIFLKFPTSILPIINVYAEFYYKNEKNHIIKPDFEEFYSSLIESGFYSLIPDLSDFLYTISMSIQLFIFYRFDKKFKSGFDKIIFSSKENKPNLQIINKQKN